MCALSIRSSFVWQPPTIRHRVLRCSDALEVLEISAPAEHATLADHVHTLPDEVKTGDETLVLGGQRFVRHVAARASAQESDGDGGFAWHETEVGAATDGLARVRLGVGGAAASSPSPPHTFGEANADDEAVITIVYVVSGSASLHFEEATMPSTELSPSDCVSVPPGHAYRLTPTTPDTSVIEVRLGKEAVS